MEEVILHMEDGRGTHFMKKLIDADGCPVVDAQCE